VTKGVYREAWHGGEEGFGREEDPASNSNG
jgi:hypothetical protein